MPGLRSGAAAGRRATLPAMPEPGHHDRKLTTESPAAGPVDATGYAKLAALRAGIRTYLAWAEQRAHDHDMTPAQVQLALAIRAHGDAGGPTVSELADTLLLRHHSVVGLIDRAEHAGFVARARDTEHQSRVRVRLTAEGAERLERLSGLHLQWLAEHGPDMADVWRAFGSEAR
jgi:DNA-binding MarR family transcriptional regulator